MSYLFFSFWKDAVSQNASSQWRSSVSKALLALEVNLLFESEVNLQMDSVTSTMLFLVSGLFMELLTEFVFCCFMQSFFTF